jgi:hypothetical protein
MKVRRWHMYFKTCGPSCKNWWKNKSCEFWYDSFLHYIVKGMSDSRRGFALDISCVDHFNTQFIITLSAIVNFHTLQITTSYAKSFPARSVFKSICLVTASNNGYSSAFLFKSCLNGGSLQTELRVRVKVRVTLRLAVYRQSFVLATTPWHSWQVN